MVAWPGVAGSQFQHRVHRLAGETYTTSLYPAKGYPVLDLPVWFEVGSLVVLGLILLIDLLLVVRRPHEPSMKEAGLWVAFYVTLALCSPAPCSPLPAPNTAVSL